MPSAGFKSRVEQILGPSAQVHAVAAVRLYVAEQSKWEWTKVAGAAAIATNDSSRYLYVVDLNNNSIPLTQELYENFGYEAPRDFFHSFEMDDCVAGFSFADTADAKAFLNAVRSNSPSASQAPARALPPVRPPPVTVTPSPAAPPQQFSPAYNTQPPSTPTHQPTQPPTSPTLPKSASAPAPAQASSAKKKPSGGGFFNKLKSAFASSDAPEDFVISDPRAFRHESHIGWDPDAGFEIRNIPPEWRKLFQAAGVKKGDLRDPETAKFVMNVIGDTMLNAQAPPAEEAPREPPARTNRTAGTFEPTAGGPPPSTGGGGPPPPPPPPPPMAKGPAPPPMPTNKSAGKLPPTAPDARGDLMKSIVQGKELRKVDPNDPKGGLPDINNMNATESKNLVDTLAAAMNARRNALQNADEDEQPEEEEWSD